MLSGVQGYIALSDTTKYRAFWDDDDSGKPKGLEKTCFLDWPGIEPGPL